MAYTGQIQKLQVQLTIPGVLSIFPKTPCTYSPMKLILQCREIKQNKEAKQMLPKEVL